MINVMISSNEEGSFAKMKPMLIFLLVVMVGISYQFFFRRKIFEQGVFTKCTLVNAEGYKGGKLLTIKYVFNGIEYEVIVHGSLSKAAIGTQYLVKVLPGHLAAPLFLEDNPVPECLHEVAPPPAGWEKMPVCK